MTARDLPFSTFSQLHDPRPTLRRGWSALVEALSEIKVTSSKRDVGLYSPAVFAEGSPRSKEAVMSVSFGVLDIDKASKDQVVQAVQTLAQDLGLELVVHSTHGHGAGLEAGKYKCRVVVPFSRAVEPDEWDRVWHGLNELTGWIADPACLDASHIYFLPSTPPAYRSVAFTRHVNPTGKALDIDLLLRHAKVPESAPRFVPQVDSAVLDAIPVDERLRMCEEFLGSYPPAVEGRGGDARTLRAAMVGGDFGLDADTFWPVLLAYNQRCAPPWSEGELRKKLANAERYRKLPRGWRVASRGKTDVVTVKHLKDLARALGKKRDAGPAGRWLERAIEGEAISVNPEQVYTEIARACARAFPSVHPQQLADLLGPSLASTCKAGHRDVTRDWFAQTFKHEQSLELKRRARAKMDQREGERMKIYDAFRMVGIQRDTPYTQEEIAEFCKEAGVGREEFRKRWVVQYHRNFYYFVAGRYTRPHGESEALNAARICLAPAQLDLTRTTKSGEVVPLTAREIAERYGTIARHVEINLTVQHSQFDQVAHVLVEAPRHPLRQDLRPEYHPHVEAWLRSLTPDPMLQEKILDWVACCSKIEDPCAALVLYGQPQSGKSFMADALARLWIPGGGATPLEDVAEKWNSLIVEDGCPLLLADEQVPQDRRGNPDTAALRSMLARRSTTLKRKTIPDATVKGCVRLVVALNDLHGALVPDSADLTNDAISALVERFLCIRVPSSYAEPRKVLAEIRSNPRLAQSFFKGDDVAEFSLYLARNREVTPGGRFLVEGLQDSELTLSLMAGTGLRSLVSEWIARWLLETPPHDLPAGGPVVDVARDGSSRVLLTAAQIHNLWDRYQDAKRIPAIGSVEKALGGICPRRARKVVGGHNQWYRVVDLHKIKYFAVAHGICSSEELFDARCAELGLHDVPALNIMA